MSLFLTRLLLEARTRDVQRDLSDCQRLHRRVMSAFPDGEGLGRHTQGVLFRLEEYSSHSELLVQSKVEPDWSSLPNDYLAIDWFGASPVEVKSMDGLLGGLTAGQILRFRLRANPTRRIDTLSAPDGSRRHGRRVPLRQEEARRLWLARRAEQAGFAVLEAALQVPRLVESRHERVQGVRPSPLDRSTTQRVTLEGVTFDGILRVVDAPRLREAVAEGVGPGKAYGFGLLSLAPG